MYTPTSAVHAAAARAFLASSQTMAVASPASGRTRHCRSASTSMAASWMASTWASIGTNTVSFCATWKTAEKADV